MEHTEIALPPDQLRFVGGSTDPEEYLRFGALGYGVLTQLLESHGLDPSHMQGILDFGCGCGRVLRYWCSSGVKGLAGCDYNPSLLGWCEDNLPFAKFFLNRLEPPLVLADGSFDLVYAFSVLTHLPERLQFAWMRELARVLRPGTHLVMSTHGVGHLDVISEHGIRELPFFPTWQQALFHAGQLVIVAPELAGANGCAAFHPEIFVRNVLAPCTGFTVVDFVPKGALGNPHQDLYLLQKIRDTTNRQAEVEMGRMFEEWYLGALPGTERALHEHRAELETVLDGIFQSRGWKLLELLRAPFGRRWSRSPRRTK